jgi:alanine-synthesizing transaminase
MFSSRLEWRHSANAIGILRNQMSAAGQNYADLTLSNPTRAGIEYPANLLDGAFDDPGILTYEPEALGLPTARQQIAHLEQVDPSHIAITASTSEAYAWLFKLLANPGDEILTPAPSYPLFDFLAALESVQVRHYPLHYDHGWFIDMAELEAQVTARTRAIVLVNPNNPTGSYVKDAELSVLRRVCRRHNIAIISDEVFSTYQLQQDAHQVTSLKGVEDVLTFCLSGLSKLAGLPQMKLGWVVTAGPQGLAVEALKNLELIADTYLSVGAPVQYALPALLRAREPVQQAILARVKQNLRTLEQALSGAPVASLLQVEGGWSAIVRVPQVRSEEQWVLHLLRNYQVLVQPGYFYDFENEAYLVVSLLPAPALFSDGVNRIVEAVNAS